MTPAVDQARRAKIEFRLHQYEHEAGTESWGLEAAQKTGTDARRVFKTLVATLGGGDLAVAVIPVEERLNLKSLAKAAGVKKAAMAEPALVERSTGYVLGGVSPLGQRKRFPTLIHTSAKEFDSIFVSGGRRGLEIELRPDDLAQLTAARFANLCR
jgi:Cys-tRNA(Pro)/Cys-tRNA(Cys) deacylase